MSPCHLDLEATVEAANIIDLNSLPIDRLDVALKAALHHSGVQEIDGVVAGYFFFFAGFFAASSFSTR